MRSVPQVQTQASTRRLPPKQPRIVTETMKAIRQRPAALFLSGDVVHFEDRDGRAHSLMILDIHADGNVDAAVYLGRPYPITITLGDLLNMRVVRIEKFKESDVAMYRSWLSVSAEEMGEAA